MSAYDTRRRNLGRLLEEWRRVAAKVGCAPTDTAFARYVKAHPTHLNALKLGRRDMGDKLARQIEAALTLPAGWMDDADPGVTDDDRKLLEELRNLDASSQAAVRELIRNLGNKT